MKLSLITFAFLVAAASGAQAQSMYAGLAYSSFGGENEYEGDGEYELKGDIAEVFFGVTRDMGTYSIGGELSVTTGAVYEEGYEDEYEFTSIVDLKGRLGYNAGQFMPYGILGLSVATFEVDGGDDFSETSTGVIAGLGAEYAITQSFAIGAEFATRRFSIDDGSVESAVNSASLRGSFRF